MWIVGSDRRLLRLPIWDFRRLPPSRFVAAVDARQDHTSCPTEARWSVASHREPFPHRCENVAREPIVRSLRLAAKVQASHVSFGGRYLERILTVSETCRLQNRNAYAYLIAAMQAKFSDTAAPSLLRNSPATTASAA